MATFKVHAKGQKCDRYVYVTADNGNHAIGIGRVLLALEPAGDETLDAEFTAVLATYDEVSFCLAFKQGKQALFSRDDIDDVRRKILAEKK